MQRSFRWPYRPIRGGSLEYIGSGGAIRHFLAISNDLNSPKVLTCPNDYKRKPTTAFATLSSGNLSYFVGLDAVETEPQSILSGDRNVSTNGRLMSGILTRTSDTPVSWTKDIHVGGGNIGLGDGSAQQASNLILQDQLRKLPSLPTRLEIP